MPSIVDLRSIKGAFLGGALLVASSSAGLVWLSIAAVDQVATALGAFWARLLVGLLLLAPLAVFVFVAWLRDQERRNVALAVNGGNDAALGAIAAAAQKLIEKSPLAALSLASLAGLVATSYPAALTLLASVLTESDAPGEAPPQR